MAAAPAGAPRLRERVAVAVCESVRETLPLRLAEWLAVDVRVRDRVAVVERVAECVAAALLLADTSCGLTDCVGDLVAQGPPWPHALGM